MADQTSPTTTPTVQLQHAHRTEDGRVLATADDHELHAFEQELAAVAPTTPAPSAPLTDEALSDG